jgi:quercetin dioxygenase-like cupin family protein
MRNVPSGEGGSMSNLTTSELEQLRDPSRDPVITDSDKYKAILENDRVRVLEYRDSPGQRTSPHHHPDFVLCALTAFKRKFVLSDGREAVREVRPGEVAWSQAQSHIGENVGSTDTHVLIIELK